MAGRPRQFDRSVALKQVQEVFWVHGYDGTAMSDLVEATGLASGRLYAAFGDKENLFLQAVDLYRAEEGAFVDRALAGEAVLARALRRMFRDAIEVYTQPTQRGCMLVSAAMACTPEHQSMRDRLEAHRRTRRRTITARVRAAAEGGDLPGDADVQRMGDYLTAVLDGLSVQARDGVPRRRLAALADMTLSVLPG
ncbi:TetR/AcrR family transcriptional regulator [Mycolicibacterium grossiae]|uniref:HTH tetR-type domain-containing protein n=1 Tax=Mycolicibacterium grossiae TaxID=1552759 RepID=A0A1E8Q839_9MYCO|nr:TetR/AcrR family transcriptional regulator [Mycolicibacterium grossiae]OFJ54411.1 hypothetical protein BEL07_07520 [Mycolicibacterium grossiae]QEM45409.1 TetR/AcrR family transcriptional regulator [Mycolicibacterium grossiae]